MERDTEGLLEEVNYAVEFWVSHLATWPKLKRSEKEKETKDREALLTELDSACLDIFREELSRLLHERFSGHWYPEEKLRGSAYRSISYDTRMDNIFIRAAEKAGVDRIEERLEPVRFYIMFINPGEVKVRNTRLWTSEAKYIWSKRGEADEAGSASPPTSPISATKSTSNPSVPSPSSTNSSPSSIGSSDARLPSNSPSDTRARPSPSDNRPNISSQVSQLRRKPSPSPFMNGSSVPLPRRSPSPPPLSLDQPYPSGFSAHSFTGSTRFREPSPGTGPHPDSFSQLGPSHPSPFGRPPGNPLQNGASFPYNNKYGYPAPRSRTPSPPLLPSGNNFYRSHSASGARLPVVHHHHAHELPRPHVHPGLQHEYGNRFLPRYRAMGLTRS